MTAPVIQSVQYTGTTLYIIFDRAVTGISDLSAFTFTKTGPSVITPVFSSIDNNAVIGTLATPITAGQTLVVDYTDPGAGATQVLEAASPNDVAIDFTSQLAVEYYAVPVVRRAQVAAAGVNDEITIFFGEPVGATAADLVAGFVIEYNDTEIDLSSATAVLNEDQTELTIDTGINPLYSDVVDIAYTATTGELYSWATGAVVDFTLSAITNSSTDGLPTSAYPLSFVMKKELSLCGSVVTACLQVILNPIDRQIVQNYGTITAYTGGTFGVTIDNPAGLVVVGAQAQVVDGAEICQTFSDATSTKFATDAAADWQGTVTDRIGVALGEARAVDQSITLTGDTVEAV